jgi:tetratricopeptide (TPR) repeat protein
VKIWFDKKVFLMVFKPLWTQCLILAMGLIPLAGYSQNASLPESLQSLFASGVKAQKQGDLEEAEKAFLKVLEQGGKLSFVYNNLGAVYQQRKQHAQALAEFREAIRLQPDYAAPRILAGASLTALGKISEAIKELEQAVKLEPNEPLARIQLAQAYDQADNFFGLIEQYQRLRQINPKDSEYTYQLGRAFMRLTGWCSQEIEKINPSSARLYQSIANNYVYQSNKEKAIEYLKRAIQADPKLAELHLALAQLYAQQGQVSEALREIDLELSLVPNSLAALTMQENLRKK